MPHSAPPVCSLKSPAPGGASLGKLQHAITHRIPRHIAPRRTYRPHCNLQMDAQQIKETLRGATIDPPDAVTAGTA